MAALLPAQTTTRQPVELKVYVKPLEGPDAELAKSVRAKLISNLEKHGVLITESKENADAILGGSGLMQAATNFRGRPHIHVLATMRLVNKNGVVLWAGDVSSGSLAISESASFVEKVTSKVAVALAEESKRRNSEPAAQTTKNDR
jgi:proteasome assembly chaperone (PAC2) family protein